MVTLRTKVGYPSAGAVAHPWQSEIKKYIPRLSVPRDLWLPNMEHSARCNGRGAVNEFRYTENLMCTQHCYVVAGETKKEKGKNLDSAIVSMKR